MPGDLRELIDALSAVLAARPRYREIPASTYTPPGTQADPTPDPVPVPARLELYTEPADLPAEVVNSDGSVDLGHRVELLHAALAWLWGEMQIRTVSGRAEVSGTYQANATADYPITWDQTPLKVPTGGDVLFRESGYSIWAGRMTGFIVPGSETLTGATLRVQFGQSTAISALSPVRVEVKGMYLYVPPFAP